MGAQMATESLPEGSTAARFAKENLGLELKMADVSN
jgi:hypothetical protein